MGEKAWGNQSSSKRAHHSRALYNSSNRRRDWRALTASRPARSALSGDLKKSEGTDRLPIPTSGHRYHRSTADSKCLPGLFSDAFIPSGLPM
ncbi:hypothetical protein DENSPDRAFT_838473 [Dentipellis sp. KUC8613]|nr:hypothetical protein DENSPDRAFT_838473 [Dentipellis sp. KUC8613]